MVDERTTVTGGLVAVSRTAMEQLSQLTGSPAMSVSELARSDGGWRMRVEIVELERVPQSTSLLATYEVDTDAGGDVVSFRRVRRYARSEAGEL
ncbi:gas vesicle protein GvpO [Phytohabitans sp. ZYX-F-186]|uniref:Gas vesicle protein GvpO n=1 Tax=Phytohabitans maris TaxID=3071409 RepID=A0ABU0ZTS5_9ACTN|nr:gas vesicle protein GvpO [Phytohabitans sp. ZYX-F-186]MDQ7910439.1 gas vesicle protein GvpO [Phytohabitans sp. ZYX-F-186]